jgi:glycosyltransferase involved in cell wall biosynthesis
MLYAPRLEPFGLAPLEANACGLPVIAVPEGGVRETILDGVNGWLVPDENAMATVLERLLKNPEEARRLGENGIALVDERWSMEAAIDRLENVLFDVVARSRRTR